MTGCGSSCGACKFLRRKCTIDCVFAPYFSYDEATTHFAAVHKIFGASNVSRLLSHIPLHNRSHAAITVSYEALARFHDPKYGCVAHIYALQQQVASLQEEILSVMTNSGVGFAGYESSLPPKNSNNGLELSNWENEYETTKLQNYHDQLANNLISQEGSARVYQSLDDQMQMDIDFTNNYPLGVEDHLFGQFNLNTLEELLSEVDQNASLIIHG